MTQGEDITTEAFEAPLPTRHEERHSFLFARESAELPAYTDFEDPADRITACELPRKSLLPAE